MARKGTKRKIVDMGEKAPAATMPPVVIRLVSLVRGGAHPLDGRYVMRYHPGPPSMPLAECLLVTTTDIHKAKVYRDVMEANEDYMRVDPRQPIRAYDGRPNRPMTSWSVEYVSVVVM